MKSNVKGTSPKPSEALLGFDAREMFASSSSAWDEARRQKYILREDVRKPLSVDVAVWPSLFGEGLPDSERKRLEIDSLRLPEWKGPNDNLWNDLQRMRSSLGRLASEPHWLVAVSWISLDGFSEASGNVGPYREEMTPDRPGADWTLLGFDVADAGFTSGLLNCGYDPKELPALRATWASSLNEHHLFTEAEKALAFKEFTDKRVVEHAPFFVFAISVIRKSDAKERAKGLPNSHAMPFPEPGPSKS
jgi:hypothetical protein